MGFKLETNLFDITKSISIFLLIVFLFFNYGKFTSWLDKPSTSDNLTPRIEKLEEGLIKYTAQANTSDLKDLIKVLKENGSLITKIDNLEKKIDEVTIITTKLQSESKIQSGDGYKDEDKPTEPSSRDFYDTVVSRADSKGEQLPMARIFFHPELVDSEPWTVQNFPLDLHTNIIQTENKDGSYSNYVETYFTNDFVSTSKGKNYYFNSDVTWAKKEISDKSFMFNTRLGLSSNVSIDDVYPSIDLSFASYGRTERDIDWRFLSLGIGGNKNNFMGYIKPVEYNVGNFVPIIENVFVGPFIGFGSDGTKIGGGISVLF